MADLSPLGFNPANIEDMGNGFSVVPPDIYNVMIVESAVKDTQKGGKLLELKYQIIDGPHVGTTLIDRLNIANQSEVAQKIGLSQLKNICDAIGFSGVLKDSNQLHGKVFAVKVVVEEFESNKEAGKMLKSNKIEKRMSKAEGAALKHGGGGQSSAQQDQPKKAMGW